MTTEERSYTVDTQVNKFKLDDACEEQATICMYWNEKADLAKVTIDKRNNKLTIIKAEVDMEIRKKALDKKGNLPNGVKATADAIKNSIETDPRVKEQNKKIIEAYSNQATYRAAAKAMDHKKSEIDNLVKLWQSGYFSDPNRKRKVDDMSTQAKQSLNKNKEH